MRTGAYAVFVWTLMALLSKLPVPSAILGHTDAVSIATRVGIASAAFYAYESVWDYGAAA